MAGGESVTGLPDVPLEAASSLVQRVYGLLLEARATRQSLEAMGEQVAGSAQLPPVATRWPPAWRRTGERRHGPLVRATVEMVPSG